MKNTFRILLVLLLSFELQAQEKLSFANIDAVLLYAEKNTAVLKISKEQVALSKYQTLISKINAFNPRGNATASTTDNLQLPTNYLAAQIFGGVPGTFKETQFGQQYISTIAITPQIDLINIPAWQKIKASKINENYAATTTLIVKKNLFETITTTYYNIVSIQKQIEVLHANYSNTKKIEDIVSNKQKEGLARQQDLNQATANVLQIEDKQTQLATVLLQQNNILKTACDIPITTVLEITDSQENPTENTVLDVSNTLLSQQSMLFQEVSNQELKSFNSSFFPTLSLVGNWMYQDNSNTGFFNPNSNTFQASYVGLRLNYALPDASKYLQKRNLQTAAAIAEENAKHNLLQENNQNQQLKLEYQKAIDSYIINQKIAVLKMDTYTKNLDIYHQDLISLDNLMISFNEKLNSELNLQVIATTISYLTTKINLNNNIQ